MGHYMTTMAGNIVRSLQYFVIFVALTIVIEYKELKREDTIFYGKYTCEARDKMWIYDNDCYLVDDGAKEGLEPSDCWIERVWWISKNNLHFNIGGLKREKCKTLITMPKLPFFGLMVVQGVLIGLATINFFYK